MSLIQDAQISLGAINEWMSVIQANLEGTRKIAYKKNDVSFTSGTNIGPGSTSFSASTSSVAKTTYLPSPALQISHSFTNFEQGDIFQTTELFDTAIQGEGFYYLTDSLNPLARNYYISRDGQFHIDEDGNLVNRDGLYVLNTTTVLEGTQNTPPIPPYTEPGEPGVWEMRDQMRVTNTFTLDAPAGSLVTMTLDCQSYIDQGFMQADLDDLRITYWDGSAYTTIPVQIDTSGGMNAVQLAFQTAALIPAGGHDDNYFLQYGNPDCGPGPTVSTLTYSDDFDGPGISADWTAYSSPAAASGWQIADADIGGCGVETDITQDTSMHGDVDTELIDLSADGNDRRLILTNSPGGNPYLWTDYRVTVKAGTQDHDEGGLMVLFRYQDDNNFYRFVQTAGGDNGDPNAPAGPRASRRIEKVVAGVTTVLWSDSFLPTSVVNQAPNPGDYHNGNTATGYIDQDNSLGFGAGPSIHMWETDIDVECRSNNIMVYQNGVLIQNITDSTAPFMQGTVALGHQFQPAFFENINVVPLPLGTAQIISSNGGINVGSLFGGSPGSSEWQEYINQNLLLVRPVNQQGLVYSEYGSTVFDMAKSQAGMLIAGTASEEGMGYLRVSSLENSNASFTEYLPMLSSAQKLFAAISKIISVANTQLDDVNQMVR